MSVNWDRLEQRLGAVTLVRFGNASLTLAGGNVIQGMYDDAPREAMVGDIRANAHEMTFTCTDADAADLVEGAQVTLTYRGQTRSCRVAERFPDDVHMGHSIVMLAKRAS